MAVKYLSSEKVVSNMEKDRVLFIISITLMALGILTVTVWAILKSIGLIHSPDWAGMIPVFGGVVAVIGICISAEKQECPLVSLKYYMRGKGFEPFRTQNLSFGCLGPTKGQDFSQSQVLACAGLKFRKVITFLRI